MIDNVYSVTPQQINYILELNVERNFQRASDKCFVTQPTLSMQVKKAEDLLGFSIFDRSRSPIELTPAGEDLIPILKDIQIEYARIATLTQKVKGTYTEQLKIGIIPTISAYLLLDIFEEVRMKMPHVMFKIEELKSEELVQSLEANEIDFGIMAGPHIGRRMRTVPLFQEEIKIYFPTNKKKLLVPTDLELAQPWLLSKGNCLRTQMVHFCSLDEGLEVEGNWSYEGGNIELLVKMVDLNGGYTLVPEYYRVPNVTTKRLMDDKSNAYPAREVIAILPSKSLKAKACEELIRIIQLHYNNQRKENLQLLSWK